MKWRQSTISRMLSNELYIGHRKVTFHKPNVDKKNKNREVYFEYDVRLENLRIVSDELFLKFKTGYYHLSIIKIILLNMKTY